MKTFVSSTTLIRSKRLNRFLDFGFRFLRIDICIYMGEFVCHPMKLIFHKTYFFEQVDVNEDSHRFTRLRNQHRVVPIVHVIQYSINLRPVYGHP